MVWRLGESAYAPPMPAIEQSRADRRTRTRSATRIGILDAARRLAEREGARNLSLRGVAAEAGFAPAALYVYFRNRDELMVALAADDLARLAQAMRQPRQASNGESRLAAAGLAALDHLSNSETLAAALGAIGPELAGSDVERLFNGRLIAALTALSALSGGRSTERQSQVGTLTLAAALVGLAVLSRGGRLTALGFCPAELLSDLAKRFSKSSEAA